MTAPKRAGTPGRIAAVNRRARFGLPAATPVAWDAFGERVRYSPAMWDNPAVRSLDELGRPPAGERA